MPTATNSLLRARREREAARGRGDEAAVRMFDRAIEALCEVIDGQVPAPEPALTPISAK